MSQDIDPIDLFNAADMTLIRRVEQLIARCKREKLVDGALPADSTLRREILEMKGRMAFTIREREKLEG